MADWPISLYKMLYSSYFDANFPKNVKYFAGITIDIKKTFVNRSTYNAILRFPLITN